MVPYRPLTLTPRKESEGPSLKCFQIRPFLTAPSIIPSIFLDTFVPDVWKLSDQNSHLHLDGGDVLQLDDLRDVRQGAVQPAGRGLLTGRETDRQADIKDLKLYNWDELWKVSLGYGCSPVQSAGRENHHDLCPCTLTRSLKRTLICRPSSLSRPAILFLIFVDVQMILPRITERRYSITTRRWTSATSSLG